ncbi:MAG: redoxin domain-containing protein [Planctomycetes bacterium]|nr:redoxin domain-containing protein [Planctomycetota bacterium]
MLKRCMVGVVIFSIIMASCVSKYSFQLNDKKIDISESVPDEYLEGVRKTLVEAGGNAPELLKVITSLEGEELEWACFLIGTMPFPDSVSVTSDYLLEHIRYTSLVKKNYKWVKKIPKEIFLASVLSYRVSEEPITRHRKYFYEQIYPLVKDCRSMLEVSYQVNLWLGGADKKGKRRVTFKPGEARDKSPFSTLKAGYGRCEEMMIIFISAARAAGIPARNVWTPWWSITDNNHAWTEVWADGEWYPAGSCEPNIKNAFALTAGKAWFSKHASVGAIIYSSQFGKPKDKSRIYKSDDKTSIINVLDNYSITRTVKAHVVSDNGKPLPGIPVGLSLVNWGNIRTFTGGRTDKKGNVSLITGLGSYFLSAGIPEKSGTAWKLIDTRPSDKLEVTLRLTKDNKTPEGYFMLRYPSPEEAYRLFKPDSGDDRDLAIPDRIKKINAEHAPAAPKETVLYEEFKIEEHSGIEKLIKNSSFKDAVVKVLKKSGGNWRQIAGAIKEVSPEKREDLLWLVSQFNLIDSLEFTGETLLEHVDYAHLAKKKFTYKIPEKLFRPYVLSYRLPYAHIYQWRKEFYEMFSPMVKSDIPSTAKSVNRWIEKNIKVVNVQRGRYLNFANPADYLKSRRATKFALTLISVSALRSLGIPAKRKENWVEFFDGEKWIPFYPKESKSIGNTKASKEIKKHYVKHGGVRIVTMKDGLAFQSKDPNHGIATWRNGAWRGQRWDEITFDNGWMSLVPGDYLITAARRNASGDVLLYARPVKVRSDKGLVVNIPLDLPLEFMAEGDKVVRHLKSLPDFTLMDKNNNSYHLAEALKESNILLFFFTLEAEPSIRMLPRIKGIQEKARAANVKTWTIFTDKEGVDDPRIKDISLPMLLDKNQEVVKEFIPEFEKKKKEIMPSVLLINKSGQIILWKEGYNLTIGAILEDVFATMSGKKPETNLEEMEKKVTIKEFASLKGLEYAKNGFEYIKAADYEKAVEAYEIAVKDISDVPNIWYNLACAYSRCQKIDDAFNALKKAVDLGYKDFDWMKKDEDLENIRKDKRFKAIVK